MLDDLSDFLTYISKSFLRRGRKQAEILEQYNDVEFRISVRRAAFGNLLLCIIFVPIIVYDTKIFYPFHLGWWDSRYWLFLVTISAVQYVIAVIITPKVKRAKYVYLLRMVYLLPFWLFLIIFGQVLTIIVLPNKLMIWYFLFQLPVLVYSPIMYQRKLTFLKTIIRSSEIKWRLKKDPIWDHKKYLPVEFQNWLTGWKSCLFPIGVFLFLTLLIEIHQFFSYDTGNLIRTGILNAGLLFTFVEISYRSIIIFYLITELENEIFQPIEFGDFGLIKNTQAFPRHNYSREES